jgi:hypothetical protein
VTAASEKVTVVGPHASVAVAELNALVIAVEVGLQPNTTLEKLPENVGGFISSVHVTVREVVDVLLQASLAVNVLVCERPHADGLVTDASVKVTVVGPHTSVALAEPSAKLISDAAGLQPKDVPVPFAEIVGGVKSSVHVTVREVVDVLLQASLAVNVLVCDLEHVLLLILPSFCVIVTAPQASVAVAEPSARLISEATGLQPKDVPVPFAEIVGGVKSSVHVTVREVVDVLLQASLAVNVLVCDLEHVLLLILPSFCVIVTAPQASLAVAEPSARLISEAGGLQPKDVLVPFAEIVGGILSAIVIVWLQLLVQVLASLIVTLTV